MSRKIEKHYKGLRICLCAYAYTCMCRYVLVCGSKGVSVCALSVYVCLKKSSFNRVIECCGWTEMGGLWPDSIIKFFRYVWKQN